MIERGRMLANRTKEEMFNLLAEHASTGHPVKQFCEQKGLSAGMFYYWQKKYKSGFSGDVQAGAFTRAMAYSIKRWDKLSLYATTGNLHIDNNAIERCMRQVAVGRKNWLFCGSHEAAKRAGLLYSLVVTCKLNDVNPYEWLKEN